MSNYKLPEQSTQAISPFDGIRQIDEQGFEYWSARDLMPLLGYTQWRRFEETINRAKISFENLKGSIDGHFTHLPGVASGRGRFGDNYQLSRYACYLVAMNGDPRKPEIAQAQAYFVIKTREAEVQQPQPQPMTQIQILLATVSQLAEQEQRTLELERRQQQTEEAIAQIFRERLEATERLNALPKPTVETPSVTPRQLVRRAVNEFCTRTGASQQDIWKKLYKELYYRCGVSVNTRKRTDKQSKLDLLSDVEMNQLYAITIELLV